MFDEVKFNPRPLKVEYCATFLNVAIDVNFVDVNVVDVNKIFKIDKKFYFAPLHKDGVCRHDLPDNFFKLHQKTLISPIC